MGAQPLVSVLMPAYNCAAFIKQAINSIINQTYTNWELLIADDCSKDNTRKIAEGYTDPRIKFYHNTQNLGYLQTWNKLAALAKGEYITFQDADDYCAPNRIELLLNYMLTNPTCGACGSNYIWVSEDDKELKQSNFELTHAGITKAMPAKYEFIGSALMIKKEVLSTIGYYNLFFDRMGGEDHYWLYLITEKYEVANITQHLYYYRYNTQSVSGNLTNNPKKIFTGELIDTLINQRKTTGTDDLADGNTDKLNKWYTQKAAPFLNNKAHLYSYLSKRRFYEGHKQQALQLAFMAIKLKPFNINYIKDYFYFFKNKNN
ncbi:MAG: glycosyltransferase [Sphingobacteriales bacterium JAD_PAG50586_3]|nr:MAG: glycosyltransferase [Sphingobacteriales bacterium JAD_PAG50586_3]